MVTPFWDSVLEFSSRKLAVHGLLLVWTLSLVVVFATVWEARPGPRWRKGLEAERLCNRVAVIDAGKLLALDTPEALIKASRPRPESNSLCPTAPLTWPGSPPSRA